MKIFEKNIIKVEKEDLQDARLSAIDFEDIRTKKRAFVNVLGARLAMKMLFSKKIEANNVYSLYTIRCLLEELDISDIYLNDTKIDIRLVFDRKQIFIPKSHFEYNLVPDLYLVLELQENQTSAEFLGFFEPSEIDRSTADSTNLFFDYDKLREPKELKSALKQVKLKNNTEIPQEAIDKSEELFLSLVDKEISDDDKLFLLHQLAKSFSLREKMVELENFEIISKSAAQDESLFTDETLEIVAAQQVFENDVETEKVEFANDEIDLDSLLDNLESETENGNDNENEQTPEDSDFDPTELFDETEQTAQEKTDEDSHGAVDGFVAGAIGGAAIGALAGGLAAGAANTDASLEVAASGLDLLSELAKGSANIVSDSVDLINNIAENSSFDTEAADIKNSSNIDNAQDLDDLISEIDGLEDFSTDEIKTMDESHEDLTINDKIENLVAPTEETTIEELPQEIIDETLSEITTQDFTGDDDIQLNTLDELPELPELPELEELDVFSDIEPEEIQHINEQLPIEQMRIEDSLEAPTVDQIEEKIESVEEQVTSPSFDESIDINSYDDFETPAYLKMENLSEAENISADTQLLNTDYEFDTSDIEGFEEPSYLKMMESLPLEQPSEMESETLYDNDQMPDYFKEVKASYQEDGMLNFDNLDVDSAEKTSEISSEDESIFDAAFAQDNSTSDSKGILSEEENEFIDYTELNSGLSSEFSADFDTDAVPAYLQGVDLSGIKQDFSGLDINSDNFIDDVDNFLNGLELSDDKKVDIGQSLELDIDPSLLDDNIPSLMATPTPSQINNEQEILMTQGSKSQNDYDDETLSLLFKEQKEQAMSDIPTLPDIKDINGLDFPDDDSTLVPIYKNKKLVIAASVAVIATASLIIGTNISKQNSNMNNLNVMQPTPISAEMQAQQQLAQNGTMDPTMMQQAPAQTEDLSQSQPSAAGEQAANGSKDMGQSVSDAFLSEPVNATITKVAWEVPEDYAYNDNFRKYLQITGKNLKLNLQNSLLLATEMAYSNKVVVDLTIGRDGNLISENLSVSSGSKQIDDIVLQSVKETLRYLKMPSSEINSPSVNATLIINF